MNGGNAFLAKIFNKIKQNVLPKTKVKFIHKSIKKKLTNVEIIIRFLNKPF